MTPNDPLTVLRHALGDAEEREREARDEAARLRQAIAILSNAATGSPITPRLVQGTTNAIPREGETVEAAAVRIIRAAARPMHSREIAQTMIDSGFKTGDVKQVQSNIRKPLERSKKLRRVGSATYDLVMEVE